MIWYVLTWIDPIWYILRWSVMIWYNPIWSNMIQYNPIWPYGIKINICDINEMLSHWNSKWNLIYISAVTEKCQTVRPLLHQSYSCMLSLALGPPHSVLRIEGKMAAQWFSHIFMWPFSHVTGLLYCYIAIMNCY